MKKLKKSVMKHKECSKCGHKMKAKLAKKVHKKKEDKVEKVMHEFKEHALHSGSKKGPLVRNRKQAVAIALSEARRAGKKIKKKSK